MGPHRTQKGLILAVMLTGCPAGAQEPGWHYSPLSGEGDRATLGCDTAATPDAFTCLAVRCEDDFTTGIHVHTSRPDVLGQWEMTVDRENVRLVAEPSAAPYGGRFVEQANWLQERLEQGTFVYLRHADDSLGAYAHIGLGGSFSAIRAALAYCAPRLPAQTEPKAP